VKSCRPCRVEAAPWARQGAPLPAWAPTQCSRLRLQRQRAANMAASAARISPVSATTTKTSSARRTTPTPRASQLLQPRRSKWQTIPLRAKPLLALLPPRRPLTKRNPRKAKRRTTLMTQNQTTTTMTTIRMRMSRVTLIPRRSAARLSARSARQRRVVWRSLLAKLPQLLSRHSPLLLNSNQLLKLRSRLRPNLRRIAY